MKTQAPEILIYLSDQHGYKYSGYAGDPYIRTPNLDRIAENGVVFETAYTTAPLCVPARASFMTGQWPMRSGIYTNAQSISSDTATFAHALASVGYETVLCGRMHFVGEDQRHGFTKRIADEIGGGPEQLGPYTGTRGHLCTTVAGGGYSPVLEYDEYVVSAALDFFQTENPAKPQCVVVGVYGPHNSYVAPPEWYRYYLERLPDPDRRHEPDPIVSELVRGGEIVGYDPQEMDRIRQIRAAYYGMVSTMDEQLGKVKAAWEAYLQRTGREGIFIYLSDHGDMLGEKGLYAKQVFYEPSARIPLLMEGFNLPAGHRTAVPCTIADLAPTLCELTGAPVLPNSDGKSLLPLIFNRDVGVGPDRLAVSELLVFPDSDGTTMVSTERKVPAVMVRDERYKFIQHFQSKSLLFDLQEDPREENNLVDVRPDLVDHFQAVLSNFWYPEAIIAEQDQRHRDLALIRDWRIKTGYTEKEQHPVPDAARVLPVP